MIILAQDKLTFVIVGKGTAFSVIDLEDFARINAYAGNGCFSLGDYKNLDQAQKVLNDIYESIGSGTGKYKMPPQEAVDRRCSGKCGLGVDINEMNLSVRAYNVLKRGGLNTVEDVLATPVEDLAKLRNMGRKTLEEIIDKSHATAEELGL